MAEEHDRKKGTEKREGKREEKRELPPRELYSGVADIEVDKDLNGSGPKKQPADRGTGGLPDIEREQQPVVAHQDRRHK